MNIAHVRLVIMGLLLSVLLTACGGGGGTVGGFKPQTETITTPTITREMRYFDQGQLGTSYTLALTVPDSWVNNFSTTSNGSVITFNFVDTNGRNAPIFTLHALSESQYWKQNGNEPTKYKNIKATADTYFIYYVPIDAFFSGLSKAEYDAFKAQVPDVMTTLVVE
jgi:hypothetical protein